ncbi:DUF928 domain-containing protein [Scytonema sp. PRP1]|uniref:DUF928 domain-containing protein n=1 Tax=Scytonema sp. PRP1 TaxID=3120513 RepID=UPI00300CCDFC
MKIEIMSLPFKLITVVSASTWTLISVVICPLSIHAQTNTLTSNPNKKPNPNNQTKPRQTNQSKTWKRKQPAPSGPSAGPSRGGCPNMQKKLTSLIPVFQEPDTRYPGKYIEHSEGYTVAERPSFWFYIPYTPDQIVSSEFILSNQKGLNKAYVLITGTPGIIKVSLPDKVKLTIGEWYESKLKLTVFCSNGLQEDETAGWVRRDAIRTTINPNLPLQQQLAIYINENMWFDALESVAKLKYKDPKNQDWNQFLKSAGLEAIINEPVIDCCTPKNN